MEIKKDQLNPTEQKVVSLIENSIKHLEGELTIHLLDEKKALYLKFEDKYYFVTDFSYTDGDEWILVNKVRIEDPAEEITNDEINTIVNQLEERIKNKQHT